MKQSKRQKHNATLVEPGKSYSLNDAIQILKKSQPVKFDPSVEFQFHMLADAAASDQAVRGTVALPHGTGKQVRVVVLSKDEKGKAAKEAGADHVGGADLIEKISKGWMDFDVVVAAPQMMRDVGKLGKILGPRGLMPSPKAGTVAEDLAQVVTEVKKGRIEFKMDKQSNIHCSIGKLSFSEDQIVANAKTLIAAIAKAKPKALKGEYVGAAHVSSSMGPGVRLEATAYKVGDKVDE